VGATGNVQEKIFIGFDIGLTIPEKRTSIPGMSVKIVTVDQMENGVLVNFEDEVCAFFDAAFLYAQMDKRVITDLADDPDSAPPRPGR
jgi:hypothetical protein